MKPEAAARTLCLGEQMTLAPILIVFGFAFLVAVGLLVFVASKRPPPPI
jgi:hypothetical protein